MADKLKVEPPSPIVFIGPFEQKTQTIHQLTNISANRITTKVKCSDQASIQASPVFAVIEPNQTIPMTFQCRFADGKPTPKKSFMFGIVIADAPAGLANEVPKIKEAWAAIKDFTTVKLECNFRQPGEAPPPPPPAVAAPPPAEQAAEPAMADAPPADVLPAEEAPAQ